MIFSMPIKPLNVLIGANGVGKSNFISLFRLIQALVDGRLQAFVTRAGGADRLLYYGRKATKHIELRLEFESSMYRCILEPTPEDRLVFTLESGVDVNEVDFLGNSRYGNAESSFAEVSEHNATAAGLLAIMKQWQVYHFHDTSATADIKQKQRIDDNVFLRPDAANLAPFLYLLQQKHTRHYRNIIDTIRLVAPFFDDFVLRPDPHNEQYIKLEWREEGSEKYFDAHDLSDGTLRFICLTTLLMQPRLPSLLLIDEPEFGLHPAAIYLLAGMLQSVATSSQVIISTQSVSLVNPFFTILVRSREA